MNLYMVWPFCSYYRCYNIYYVFIIIFLKKVLHWAVKIRTWVRIWWLARNIWWWWSKNYITDYIRIYNCLGLNPRLRSTLARLRSILIVYNFVGPQTRDSSIDSREGSASPTRRRKKLRRSSASPPATTPAPAPVTPATTPAPPPPPPKQEAEGVEDLTIDEEQANAPPPHDVVRSESTYIFGFIDQKSRISICEWMIICFTFAYSTFKHSAAVWILTTQPGRVAKRVPNSVYIWTFLL